MYRSRIQSGRARLNILLPFIVALSTTPGCSLFEKKAEPTQKSKQSDAPFVAPDVDREPMLASSKPDATGELGSTPIMDEVPFEPRTIRSLRQHSFAADGSDSDACVSPDGHSMVFASTRHNLAPDIYAKSIDGVAVTQLTSDPSWDVQPAYSPDGSRVAFSSNRGGNWNIWVVNLNARSPIQITDEPGDEVHPSWSADGKQLVYCRLPPRGQWELWITEADSPASRRFIGYGLFPSWSPVENKLAFQRARSRGSRWFSIWTVELEGGEPGYPTEIASSPDTALITPVWSPDGRRLAFASATKSDSPTVPEQSDIFVVNLDGTNKRNLTDGHSANFAPTWSSDGRVYFSSTRGGAETIWSLNPDDIPITAPAKTATHQHPPRVSDVGLANDA